MNEGAVEFIAFEFMKDVFVRVLNVALQKTYIHNLYQVTKT